MKTEMDDGRWEVARGGEGRGSAHSGMVSPKLDDCKCKCIVTTNISCSYLSFGLEVGRRREVEKFSERQRERERKREKAVHKRSYEAYF